MGPLSSNTLSLYARTLGLMATLMWQNYVAFCVLLLVFAQQTLKRTEHDWAIRKHKRVLVVTAHPDDEAMFFVPLISSLTRKNYYAGKLFKTARVRQNVNKEVFVLCLSTGDYEGQNAGGVRVKELHKSCEGLGVPRERVTVVDCKELRDGPHQAWDKCVVAEQVAKAILDNKIDCVVTFDSLGVSKHVNHRDTYLGVRHLLSASFHASSTSTVSKYSSRHTKCSCGKHAAVQSIAQAKASYRLESVSITRKYTSLFDLISTVVSGKELFVSLNPLQSYRAMQAHASQFVWYRKLFVVFSRYSFFNTIVQEAF
jgi:N-acetylglucosaminylphosphatidylinositol deacetylase